ncbi:MAG: HlyD family efflux transporter periplasmic adaptor subunit [Bacillota bacterium]|nr:HlyD family efflux transporter periplasmic adaptor subunit [Bacillota bacterium]
MKKRILTIIISVVVIGGIVGLGMVNANRKKFVSVKSSTVTKGDINAYLSTTAVILSKDKAQYYGIQAKVTSVNVKLGDKVKKGDVLVTYEVQDLNNNVKQAQLQYDNSVLQKQDLLDQNTDTNNKIADLNNQITDLNNQIDVLKKGNDSQAASKIQQLNQQVSSIQTQLNNLKPVSSTKLSEADNAIALAKVSLDQAKENLAKNTNQIVADMDGTVTQLNATVGAMGNPAQVAVEVQNLDDLEGKVSASKYDMLKLKAGEEATLKYGNKTYKGKVSSVDPIAVNTTSSSGQDVTTPVYVDITDNPENLKINYDVDIDILVGQSKDVIKISAESIKTDKDGSSYVYVIEGNKAVQKKVTLGLQSDLDVEVKDGLKAGDKVILNPSATINNGTLVKDTSAAKKGGYSNAGSN